MAKRINHSETVEYCTPGFASKLCGLTVGHLARMSRNGQLTTIRPSGTHRRYLRSEIEALAAPSTPTTGEEATK